MPFPAPEPPEDYADRIKRLRGKLGLTQERFAERMGVSFASVNRWENGQTRPSGLAWQRILRAEQLGGPPGDDGPQILATPTTSGVEPGHVPPLDFTARGVAVRVVAEGERLTYGHLFNPAFATETALIDPLPHQRLAVYDHLLPHPRLRFLLADDAGAGKTIMAGLYVREMLTRRLIRRVLIVPPAGLVGNWERELRTLFNLRFRIISGADARAGNPFADPEGGLAIVSVDTLAGERTFRRLQDETTEPYDLVIFDEAHKLSADREADFRIRRTDRYRVAEALAGIPSDEERWSLAWHTNHLLFLTATPHMGKDFPYYALWRLLEPETLATIDAFHAYPAEARRRHFLRRTKEEMVRYDGSRIYPTRVSDTLSYDLTPGPTSEQALYDSTTEYIQTYYNRARLLNRSAARLAMSVFQRRLASSTYALLRSFERRLAKLDDFIEAIASGRMTEDQLVAAQRRLDTTKDVLEEKTGDEEEGAEGREESEEAEEKLLGGTVALNLAELQVERDQVEELLDLARRVYALGEESKFEKLREFLQDPRYRDEKVIIFTEHRDTLEFLFRKLEGIGFTGQVAQVHGGMDWREREEQVEFFRRPADQEGARYLVATDAAGEGINLQFCWLMVNYDVPWNPARLEQRMGRIHRYKQMHDPVVIANIVAGKTREGRVLETLLKKLETMRRELGTDKVFDVVGRLFEGVSLREYMEQALTNEGAAEATRRVEGRLTKEQIEAIEERERRLYGDGGDVASRLPLERQRLEHETYRRLLPGYVLRFLEAACPLLDIGLEGDVDGMFTLKPRKPHALDALWPVIEAYPERAHARFTIHRPADPEDAIFLRPGEPVFDTIRGLVASRFGAQALRGGVFVDPDASRPYLFHLALVTTVRRAAPDLGPLANEEVLEQRLVGLRQEEGGPVQECPVEQLLLLNQSEGVPASALGLASAAQASREAARTHAAENVAAGMAEQLRARFRSDLEQRLDFLQRGYDYQEADLAAARARLTDKAVAGDPKAKGDLTKIKKRQGDLSERREEALSVLRREPDLIEPGQVTFLAHALVVPSADPEDRKRHDKEVEDIAMRVAWSYEETRGATVRDVHSPSLARSAGLPEYPGFDLLSKLKALERAIEVKGRAMIGDVELSENEWAKACNLRGRYWLYVVYDCGSPHPRLLRVQDPFTRLITTPRGGVIIDEKAVFETAEVGA
ncbi:MAG: helicase-related protein [Methanobacteriota archaeon]